MITFGIRQSFQKREQVEERYANVKVPIELALPYYWDIYNPARVYLGEIVDKVKSYGTRVLSIHAVQAPLHGEEFRIWGKETADFAIALGVKAITVHPNNVNKKTNAQETALKNLEYFADLYKNEVIFCVETFEGKRRVFTPEEIVRFSLPMTLDVAHIGDDKKVWDLLRNYRDKIVTVHLSARNSSSQHLPIDGFCKDVVRFLAGNNWQGQVILEYLPEFHDKLIPDLESVKAMQV
ncbi:MAG: TIM barrel protein [Candidatus Omnitrophota bacterium]|nr:sugar phosphate isomerase/epimerase [Candidatus Omnitrophota bacterium]